MFNFKVIAESTTSRARAGIIHTDHGTVETPVFMPVGTQGSVKSLTPEELSEIGAQIILSNTYHLYLRPGCDVISRFCGLHRFMNWERPILTDSGGFQVFSLAKFAKVCDDGVEFQSHIDGSRHLLTPEKAIDIQTCLDADIIMCLDECIRYPAGREETQDALEITTQWAKRCKHAWQRDANGHNALFGIVQGGMFKDLREMSADALVTIDFSGYAIGGLSVGEPVEVMLDIAEFTLQKLPDLKPRYVMGVGTPQDLIELVAQGADMFDCVLPTRNARNGQMFTSNGTMNICNSRFKQDTKPVEPGCRCYTCRNYSRAYLRHLYMAKELLAYRLHTIHNIHFFTSFMAQIRSAIVNDSFDAFKNNFDAKRKLDLVK